MEITKLVRGRAYENIDPSTVYVDELGEQLLSMILQDLPNKKAGKLLAKLATDLIFIGMLNFQSPEDFKIRGLPLPPNLTPEEVEYWESGKGWYDLELNRTKSRIAYRMALLIDKEHELGSAEFSEN